MPPKPTSAAAGSRGGVPAASAPTVATSSAPAAPPAVPSRVTPPLVPGGTMRPPTISRGGVPLLAPKAVAHVSAAAPASEAVTSQRPSV